MKIFSSASDASLLGASISNSLLTIVELGTLRGRLHLKQYAIEQLNPESVVDNTVVDTEEMGRTIAQLIQRLHLKATDVATDIPYAQSISTVVEMPAELLDIDIEAQFRIDADQYIPYPLSEVNLDFEVMGPSPTDQSLVQVLLVVSLIENIEQRVDSFAFAAMKTKVVEVDIHAVERAFELISTNLANTPSTIVLLDIGHTRTKVYVAKDGEFVYQHEQLFGGRVLTESIQSAYSLTAEQADRVKANWGKHSNDTPDDYLSQHYSAFVDQLTEHVCAALQPYFDTHPTMTVAMADKVSSNRLGDIEHIVLCGGSALLPDIDAILHAAFGIPISIANPFESMTIDTAIDLDQLNRDAPLLMNACGLAMRRSSFAEYKTRRAR